MKILIWARNVGTAAIGAVVLSIGAGQVANALNLPINDADCRLSHPCNHACGSMDFVREIDDAGAGSRWMLFRDRNHPEKPGRLVLDESRTTADKSRGCESVLVREPLATTNTARKIVIRAGDRLAIQERTSRVDLQLEGTALAPAAAGDILNVRLRFGTTVRAIAVKPGQAALMPTGARP